MWGIEMSLVGTFLTVAYERLAKLLAGSKQMITSQKESK